MTHTRARDFYSVAEAAELLGVGHSTVWRWIAAGKLPAYRVGLKNIRIKKRDLDSVVQPARPNRKEVSPMSQTTSIQTTLRVPPMTEKERRRALAAFERSAKLIERMRKERHGEPLPSSVELIREMREERSRHLDQL